VGDRLERNELILVDMGVTVAGQGSDVTRMFSLSGVDGDEFEIVKTVLEAQDLGTRSGRPGTPARQVDAACRGIVAVNGFAHRFYHGTGHGLGVGGERGPMLVDWNEDPLRENMAYTVEPGVYIVGQHGARIEDDILMTEEGPRRLTMSPRDLVELRR